MIHQHHYRLHNTIHILLKTRKLFYSSCSFCLFCSRSTNAIERRHWLLASVSIASVLSEHHLFVYVRHIWSAIVWGAPSSRKKDIKRLEHQKNIFNILYLMYRYRFICIHIVLSLDIAKKKKTLILFKMGLPNTLKNCIAILCLIRRGRGVGTPVTWRGHVNSPTWLNSQLRLWPCVDHPAEV